MDAFDIFSQESCGDVSWEHLMDEPEDLSDCEPASCELVRAVPGGSDVIDLLVSPSSVSLSCVMFLPVALIGILWNRSPFLSKKKHAHCGTQEEMRFEGSPVKALPLSRRRMAPPTPLQNSFSSCVRDHGRYEEEGRGWNARERTIIERTKQYLERSFSVKVQVEALEALLGPEDVDLRRILKEARDEQGRRIFETFGSNDMSFLVADWSRWDKYKRAPWRQDSSASARGGWWQASLGQSQEQMIVGWSQDEKMVIDAVEDYLETCAQVKVKIDFVESLPRPENLEVSSRYVLEHANNGSSNIFQLFDTAEKAESPRWLQAEDDGWKVSGETSGTTLGIKEPRQKLRRAPTALYRLLCLSKARRRPEKKKIIGN